MKAIALANSNHTSRICDEDFERVSQYIWKLDERGSKQYAVNFPDPSDPSNRLWLHRFITDAPSGSVVDHIDGDGLNNQRSNLRVCTTSQNGMNRCKQKTRAAISSRFKGVTWDKSNKKWRAKIVVDGRQKALGYFHDECEAAKAYNTAASDNFGAFARLNQLDRE